MIFWVYNPTQPVIFKKHMEICMFPHGCVWIIPYIAMDNYWQAQNIFQIHKITEILGPPFQFQLYTNSNIQKPLGNLQVSTWISMHSTIPTHGQLLVGTKYLPNTYD
jgi:hypothetical protein